MVRTATETVAPHTIASADARCPRGSTALGGGFEGSVPTDNGPFPFESYRLDRRTWRASSGSGEGASPGTVSAYAVCRRGAPSLLPIYAGGGIPKLAPPQVGAVAVSTTCPPGLRAVAGGFRGEVDLDTGAALPQSSERIDKRTWSNAAIAIGGDDAPPLRGFTSIAYCAEGGRAQASATAPVAGLDAGLPLLQGVVDPNPLLGQAVSPGCRAGALSGGFSASPVVNSIVGVLASKPSGRGWQATAATLGGQTPGSVRVTAYCG